MFKAYCHATGEIAFTKKPHIPKGTLLIVKGAEKPIRNALKGLVRMAHDHKTMLVPGIPEASNPLSRIDSLGRFVDRVKAILEPNKEFIVRWEIDVSAKNATDAAKKALKIQRNPDSIATVFGVREWNPKANNNSTGHKWHTIDVVE